MSKFVVHCKRAEYDVYIGRPSRWGNQFVIGHDGTRDEVIMLYGIWLLQWLHDRPDHLEELKSALRGKILGCWCAPSPCHGDILAEIANEQEDGSAVHNVRADLALRAGRLDRSRSMGD